MGKREEEFMKKETRREAKKELFEEKLNPTQIQLLGIKYKYEQVLQKSKLKKELEELKHKNIMEEIKSLMVAGVKTFSR